MSGPGPRNPLFADARVFAAQVARYRHRAWWKAVRATLRRLPWKRDRREARREIEREVSE